MRSRTGARSRSFAGCLPGPCHGSSLSFLKQVGCAAPPRRPIRPQRSLPHFLRLQSCHLRSFQVLGPRRVWSSRALQEGRPTYVLPQLCVPTAQPRWALPVSHSCPSCRPRPRTGPYSGGLARLVWTTGAA